MKLLPFLLVTGAGGMILLVALVVWEMDADSSAPYGVPPGTDVFAVAEGIWAWTNEENACADEPQVIGFSDDRALMFITRPLAAPDDEPTVYDVVGRTDRSIRGAIRGESRLDDDGNPVVWDLVLRGPDRFAWHAAHWPPSSFTAGLMRCFEPTDPTPR